VKTAIIVSMFAVLAGCATTMSQNDISRAEGFCQNNGGISTIDNVYKNTVKVVCKNTAQFRYTSATRN